MNTSAATTSLPVPLGQGKLVDAAATWWQGLQQQGQAAAASVQEVQEIVTRSARITEGLERLIPLWTVLTWVALVVFLLLGVWVVYQLVRGGKASKKNANGANGNDRPSKTVYVRPASPPRTRVVYRDM